MSRLASLWLLTVLLLLQTPPCFAETPTQRDWLENLVDGLGWSFGLPDEPEDADYLAILDGGRLLHIEAEDAIQPEDLVSVKTYTSFGPYTGTGWVNGIPRATHARLKFLLKTSGRYQLSASLRLPGHQFEMEGQTFQGNGTENFTRAVLGEIDLSAGEQELLVTLPPNGSIDYIELKAPAFVPITPMQGWELDKPLTMEDLAITSLRLLDLQGALPPHGKQHLVEAESATLLKGAETTQVAHLGAPSGKAWVRAGAEGSQIEITFAPPTAGVFRLGLRATGTSPIIAELDSRYSASLDFPPYLKKREWLTLYLDAKPHILRVTLPPRAGLDVLTLTPLASSGEDYLNLSGLRSLGDAPTFATIDQMLTLLAPLAPKN